MAVKSITSIQNPRVKDVVKLRDRRKREQRRRFVIDGAREILLALSGQVRLVEMFVCVPLCKTAESQQILDRLREIQGEVWHVTQEVSEKMAFGGRHEGLLAVAELPEWNLDRLRTCPAGLIAVLEDLEKPGNVGAVLRSADGAGLAAVILADPRTDLFNPNCIRASLGTVFTEPVCQTTSRDALAWLRARRCKIFAARLDAQRLYTEVDWTSDAAVVLGSEAAGLSDVWDASDVVPVKLPMQGAADSLNVSATAAVLFYEARRQLELAQR